MNNDQAISLKNQFWFLTILGKNAFHSYASVCVCVCERERLIACLSDRYVFTETEKIKTKQNKTKRRKTREKKDYNYHIDERVAIEC